MHGSYQSGTALRRLQRPDNGREIAWMDPMPLDPPTPTTPGGRTNFRGGDWSSYYYNGYIYESDTRRGLYIWNGERGPSTAARPATLDYLNPQTNHLSITTRANEDGTRAVASRRPRPFAPTTRAGHAGPRRW